MKVFKSILFLLLLFFIIVSFSQCASSQKLQKTVPIKFGDIYYQEWIAEIKGGGSGVNIFIPVISNTNDIELDSVYFRGKQTKLASRNDTLFIGRFKTDINKKYDIIMSSDRLSEYGNKLPELPKKMPFDLKDTECVVSYKLANKVKYLKIETISKKETKPFR
tara:strand:+ start:50332 stop:50820 length:489 start_codon:yes stop_codon:yes gene_type:complete